MGEGPSAAAVLVVDEPDAPEEARQRGAAAAQKFFEAAGVTAYEAAAAFKRDGIQDGDADPDDMTAAEWRNAELWEEVQAVVACAVYAGRADAPEVVHVKLVTVAPG